MDDVESGDMVKAKSLGDLPLVESGDMVKAKSLGDLPYLGVTLSKRRPCPE